MPKNVLISFKNCKNRQTLGSAPRPPCLRRRPPHQTLWILLSSASALQSTDSFGIIQKILFSCNYSGSAPGFRLRKNYAAFCMLQTTKIINIGFNFFRFVPPLIFRWRRHCSQYIQYVCNTCCFVYFSKVEIAKFLRSFRCINMCNLIWITGE